MVYVRDWLSSELEEMYCRSLALSCSHRRLLGGDLWLPLHLQIGEMEQDTVFMLCCVLLTLACLCQHRLLILAAGNISHSGASDAHSA